MFLPQSLPPRPPIALLPRPSELYQDPGEFRLDRNLKISAPQGTEAVAETMADYLRPATGFPIPIGRGGTGAINLHLDPKWKELGAEGYRLQVQKNRVDVYAAKPAGLFYGFQTFRQLLPADIFRSAPMPSVQWTAPCVRVVDVPRFVWRGAHMDVSRHFKTKAFVERFLDELAMQKLNVFHWDLTNDQGWRMELKNYPKLTANGAPTDYSTLNPSSATRSKSDPAGGFYTQDDIREVVAFAQKRFITVVPAFEAVGHSAEVMRAYPELGNFAQISAGGGSTQGLGEDNVFNVDDGTLAFLKDVIDEMIALFPSKFIHVGGDEVDKAAWKINPIVQQKMKSLGLKSEDELQSWMIRQLDTYLASKGRRLIGWDEILEGGLAPGATVMSWRGIEGGIAAAKSGHDVVMAPGDWTYLDHPQGNNTNDPVAFGDEVLTVRRVYSYEPIPAELSSDMAAHVLGLQGQLWGEVIPDARHLEFQAFPRLCAIAEVGWSNPKGRSYAEFLPRLQAQLRRMSDMDVSFRPLTPEDLAPDGSTQ